jgi:16S rRNA processing protein RimM
MMFYPIGRVIKPHGVKGKIKIDYFGEDYDHFSYYKEIFIKDSTGQLKPYEVIQAIPKPPRIILRLKGIERIEEATSLTGREIFVKRENFPPLSEGEYYWVDLIGMSVETDNGKRIGKVKRIFPTGANDVIVIEGKIREIFLPAIDKVIKKVDFKKRLIEVARLEGLWDEKDEI